MSAPTDVGGYALAFVQGRSFQIQDLRLQRGGRKQPPLPFSLSSASGREAMYFFCLVSQGDARSSRLRWRLRRGRLLTLGYYQVTPNGVRSLLLATLGLW
jgi:hypothetical protein